MSGPRLEVVRCDRWSVEGNAYQPFPWVAEGALYVETMRLLAQRDLLSMNSVSTVSTDPASPSSSSVCELAASRKRRKEGEGIIGRTRWSRDEDDLLRRLVSAFGEDWSRIAGYFPQRTARLVKERWFAHVDPSIIRQAFTTDEDRRILAAVEKNGTAWTVIAELFPGRTPLMLKNRYNTKLALERSTS